MVLGSTLWGGWVFFHILDILVITNQYVPFFANVTGFDGWATEEWGDFDDSLRLQREINHLRQEVVRLHADSQHWRSVAGQLVSVCVLVLGLVGSPLQGGHIEPTLSVVESAQLAYHFLFPLLATGYPP